MSRHDDLDLRYLKALMQINKHLSHELNGYLQVLGVQLTLIGEIVHRTQPDDSAAWEKLRVYSTKAPTSVDPVASQLAEGIVRILPAYHPNLKQGVTWADTSSVL